MTLSLSGKIWNPLHLLRRDEVRYLSRVCSIPEIVARILVNRGISNDEEVSSFLDAKIKDFMPDPLVLINMDKAVDRVAHAIFNNEKVFVFGDYDVDGITSTYIIVHYLRLIGHSPEYYIPNRFSDGYGVSEHAINMAAHRKSQLFIAVDSGTNSIDEIEMANNLGIDSIILDHHLQSSDKIPNSIAVVNPNRNDQMDISKSKIKNLCAAGVVFLFVIALQRELRKTSYFVDKNMPDLTEFISIVALGTTCDVMEIVGLNRSIVNFAIKRQDGFPHGMRVIMEASNISNITSSDDFAFTIGPSINAAGRLGDPNIALEMLLTGDAEKASQLVKLNSRRKSIENKILSEALIMVEQNGLHQKKCIFVHGDGWNEGVIGVVAGKIKDKFHIPVFVATFDTSGIGKGSARSVPNANLSEILSNAVGAGILETGGGHALAGGFSISREKCSEFDEFLESQIQHCHFEKILNIDECLSINHDFRKLYTDISKIEPYGKGIEKPLFCIERLSIRSHKLSVCGKHMTLFFNGEFGGTMRGMLFNITSKNNIVGHVKDQNKFSLFDILCSIKNSEQYGPSVIIEDMRQSACL